MYEWRKELLCFGCTLNSLKVNIDGELMDIVSINEYLAKLLPHRGDHDLIDSSQCEKQVLLSMLECRLLLDSIELDTPFKRMIGNVFVYE